MVSFEFQTISFTNYCKITITEGQFYSCCNFAMKKKEKNLEIKKKTGKKKNEKKTGKKNRKSCKITESKIFQIIKRENR